VSNSDSVDNFFYYGGILLFIGLIIFSIKDRIRFERETQRYNVIDDFVKVISFLEQITTCLLRINHDDMRIYHIYVNTQNALKRKQEYEKNFKDFDIEEANKQLAHYDEVVQRALIECPSITLFDPSNRSEIDFKKGSIRFKMHYGFIPGLERVGYNHDNAYIVAVVNIMLIWFYIYIIVKIFY
jgi:hypothetical protein